MSGDDWRGTVLLQLNKYVWIGRAVLSDSSFWLAISIYVQFQERKSFHLPSNSQQLEITYSDGIVVPESDINSTEDDLNDDTDMMSEELLVESGKNEEYQVNQEPEIEEAILDDRNYNSFNKSGHVDIFDQDLAYDQNGQELRTPQSSQPHSNQSSIRQQHFVSSVLNSNERLRYDKELVDFQKELMQKEFDEVRAMRQAKHKLEMQILTAELKHKFIEHQKQLEILNKRVLQDMWGRNVSPVDV